MDYDQHVNIDLHIHSTASDGTLFPHEIIDLATKLRLGAIAITDHDTVEGAKEALSIERPSSLNLLTGVEISSSPLSSLMDSGTFHILGYGIDLDDPAINRALGILRNARRDRNPKIVHRLNALGFDLTMSEVLENNADNDQIGRPHIARVMVKKGYAQSIDNAFDLYLAVGRPAYVNKYRMDCEKALATIQDAGGIAVLAHPFLLRLKENVVLDELVITLKSMGLQGIEAYYPDHSPAQIARCIEIANQHDLLVTGGTDFHGSLKPDIQMGIGQGDFSVPYALYEKIVQKCPGVHSQAGQAAASLSIVDSKMTQVNLTELTNTLCYEFKNEGLLHEALRHSSFVNEQLNSDLRDNERFEYLGDAVLSLAVGHLLMQRDPDLKEGDLSRIRAGLVNESRLAQVARKINLGKYMQLGKGEIQSEGREKNSILANALEAVMAAVYLDSGFESAFGVVHHHFSALIDLDINITTGGDYKSQLQEWAQTNQGTTPDYRVINESGPDHNKTFVVRLQIRDLTTDGAGKSKKMAEQNAAMHALEQLKAMRNDR